MWFRTVVREEEESSPGFYNCLISAVQHFIKYYPNIRLVNTSACTPFHRTDLLCGTWQWRGAQSTNVSSIVWSVQMDIKAGGVHPGRICTPHSILSIHTCLDINMTSSHLYGVVWYSQFMSSPALARIILLNFSRDMPLTPFKVVTRTVQSQEHLTATGSQYLCC